MVLLERQVCVNPDTQPARRLFVEPYEPIPDLYLCCQHWPEVYLVAAPARKQRRVRHCCTELLRLSTCPLDALCCASLQCRDDLIDIASSCHPAEIIDKIQASIWDVLFDPLNQSWGEDHEEDLWHGWALWDPCFDWVTLYGVALDYHFHGSERKLSYHHISSPFICLTFSKLTSLPFATLGKAALMSMKCTPVMWPFDMATWALPTMIPAASMADCAILLPNCLSLSHPLPLASSDQSSTTTFLATVPMLLSRDMEQYAFSVI